MPTARPPLAAEGNQLLSRLPAREYARLRPHFEGVMLPARYVVYEPHEPLTHVYFPQDGMLSLVTVLADGTAVEVGMAGREGMAGIAAVLGVAAMPTRCLVQVTLSAHVLPMAAPRRHAARAGPLQATLHRYVQAFLDQITQGAASNRRHSLDQRCARWLLMSHDRMPDDEIPLTQEFLSYMLGVHRPAVAAVPGYLHAMRGGVVIADRAGLEAVACECYGAIQARMAAVLA